MKKWHRGIVAIGALVVFLACSQKPKTTVIASFPLDSLDGVIAQSGVQLDNAISSDGKGSLRIDVTNPTSVPIFEVRNLNIENARLIYRAKVRVEKVIGQVYLEMWCHLPDKGEFFSRGQMTLMSGTTDWTSQETPFFLLKGEVADYVKLNLVINGRGTAWIDDIQLLKAPLK